jgi:hypothetical protein
MPVYAKHSALTNAFIATLRSNPPETHDETALYPSSDPRKIPAAVIIHFGASAHVERSAVTRGFGGALPFALSGTETQDEKLSDAPDVICYHASAAVG